MILYRYYKISRIYCFKSYIESGCINASKHLVKVSQQ